MAEPIVGDGLAGATDTAYGPVKVGGKYNSTKPTLSDGQRGDAQLDLRGGLVAVLKDTDGTLGSTVKTPSDGLNSAFAALVSLAYGTAFNNSTQDRLRSASAANLALQSGLGVSMASLPGQWGIVHLPTSNTQATVSKAAVASTRHVATSVTATLASGSTAITVPATPVNVVIRDGASGAGTIIWQSYLSAITTAGSMATITASGLNLVGTANTAMTVEFSAAGGVGSFESVSLQGYSVI